MGSGESLKYDQERLVHRVDELVLRVRELEADLDRTHRLATLGTIAGSIAHEFNNILTPVMSYAQLALAAPDDRGLVAKALQKAIDGTEKAAQIASSMLGFIRDDGPEGFAEVGAVIRETLSCMARDPSKEGIELRVDVPPECWVAIKPLALHQVLLNLVLNALDAMRPGNGRLVIQAERSTWNTSSARLEGIRITVSDTGRGIPEDLLPHVFNPFVSRRHAESSKSGTGLGLSICRRLVEDAGGLIDAASSRGKGATFTIRLPAADHTSSRNSAQAA